ncbi:MAG: DUF448 domain-containing protein [Myxococcales bacterium]|nr:DUF448 domain-containing protein [Myxococcales bacterium]
MGCRQRFQRTSLVRLIPANGHLRPADGSTFRGRGIYVCPLTRCLRRALRNPRLRAEPALRFDGLRQIVLNALVQRLDRSLRIALRRGAAVSGYEAIHDAIASSDEAPSVFDSESSPSQRSERLRRRSARFGVEWIRMPQVALAVDGPARPELRLAILDVRVVDELRSSIEAIVALGEH